jgi:hypothetical protein
MTDPKDILDAAIRVAMAAEANAVALMDASAAVRAVAEQVLDSDPPDPPTVH